MHVMYWCAENLLSHFFVTQPSPIWQLNIKKLSCRSNTVWVMAFGTVWLCVLKPAWSWCFWLSLDHNEQQIWIAVIHKPTLPCVVCGWVDMNVSFLCLCFVLGGMHVLVSTPYCATGCVSLHTGLLFIFGYVNIYMYECMSVCVCVSVLCRREKLSWTINNSCQPNDDRLAEVAFYCKVSIQVDMQISSSYSTILLL